MKKRLFVCTFMFISSVGFAQERNVADSIHNLIYREYVRPFEKKLAPDWDSLLRIVNNKYGDIGVEKVAGHAMVYYWSQKDWIKFEKMFVCYFSCALPARRSFVSINNMCWTVFEHIENATTLNLAIKAMAFAIAEGHKDDRDFPNWLDTYANLLYKNGDVKSAIANEEQAINLNPSEILFRETLEKMKAGQPTWPN